MDESKGYANVPEIIESARSHIFDFSYPIFDENYRSILETKIIKHFYTREICAESLGLWKLWVDMKMNEIMPYYNQKYRSTLLEYNPFYDVDLRTEADTSGSGNKQEAKTGSNTKQESKTGAESRSNTRDLTRTDDVESSRNVDDDTTNANSGTSESDSATQDTVTFNEHNEKWKMYSDTPQGSIQNLDSNTYLTNATKDTDSKTGSDSNSGTVHSESEFSDSGSTNRDIAETETSERLVTDHETTSGTKSNTDSATMTGTETANASSNFTNTEQYLQHVYGKRGGASYSKLLDEFRKTFLNIDVEIIKEFDELFIQLY